MNDENFDKIFGDKLNKGKDFAFTEAKWNKMEKRLDAFQTAGRWQRFVLWSAVPLLALFGLLGWSGWALHQAQKDIHDLTQAVRDLRQEKTTPSVSTAKMPEMGQNTVQSSVLKSDTVYHHIVVKRYDTIFQTVVRRDLSDVAPSAQQGISTSFSNKKEGETGSNRILNPATNPQVIESKSVPNNGLTPEKSDSKPNSDAKTAITENVSTPEKSVSKPNSDAKTPVSDKILTSERLINQTTKTAENAPKSVDINDNTPKNDGLKAVSNAVLDSTLKTEITEKAAIQDSFNAILSDIHKVRNPQKTDSTTAKHPLSINAEKQVLPTEKADITEKRLEKPEEQEKKKRLPIIKPLKVAGYEIGVSGGLAIIDGQNIIRQDGFSIGGRGGILLNERLKLVAEAQYVALSYEVNKITDKTDIPMIAPPSPSDEFDEVLIQQPYIHYALGLQYAFMRTRLKPFIGFSIFGQSKLEEQFKYQFENKTTKEYVFVTTKRHEASFQMPFLRFSVGAEYPIFNKFKAQVEGSYDVKLGSSLQFQPLYQVKGAILYRF